MARRRYSDDDRANALAALAANGGNVVRTARELGLPHKTLDNWAKGACHPEAAELGSEKKGDMADALEETAWKLIRVASEKAGALNGRDAMIAAATAIDKMRLLRGEPTSITDDADSADEERRALLSGLVQEFRQAQAAGQGARARPPDEAAPGRGPRHDGNGAGP